MTHDELIQENADLRNRLEEQKEEFEKALEEGYKEAFEILQEERVKNLNLLSIEIAVRRLQSELNKFLEACNANIEGKT